MLTSGFPVAVVKTSCQTLLGTKAASLLSDFKIKKNIIKNSIEFISTLVYLTCSKLKMFLVYLAPKRYACNHSWSSLFRFCGPQKWETRDGFFVPLRLTDDSCDLLNVSLVGTFLIFLPSMAQSLFPLCVRCRLLGNKNCRHPLRNKKATIPGALIIAQIVCFYSIKHAAQST